MRLPTLTYANSCAICGKTAVMGLNRPHSLHKTKRIVRPNLGVWQGLVICANCRKTLVKPERVRKSQPVAN